MDAAAHFKGKKITVMGLGLLGRGLGDVRYLASQGADLIVTDLKTREQLASSLAALAAFPDITFVLGEHRPEDFRDRDFILKAAGVPLDSPYINEARENGIPIKMSASWFAEIARIPIVGITGTRGKSTVTHMIQWIFEHAKKKILLGGNVRGVSTLALLDQVQGNEVAIMELDSWQLQGFGEVGISPDIAVFTNLFPDHLNYYKNSMVAYLDDKAQIFVNQKEGDTLVLGRQVEEIVREPYGDRIKGNVVIAGEQDLPADWKLKVPGAHNRYNAALARAAAHAAGIDDSSIREALETFTGVPGRLELVRTVDGVAYYNDTTATTPEAAIAALTALNDSLAAPGTGGIVLVTGGADKALDMSAYVETAKRLAKRIIFLAGTGTERIRGEFPDAPIFNDLESAFEDARAHASSGDAVILSPAFASFGMFRNEFDRGDQFNALVASLPDA
ncbi:MAG: UDP-N-acetylmuramoylalanine--D-glutamate ligase [Candidatus Parcubacteria bacterium]|jgi:UDP-N-acetylmuramoylalanine--D-glutamate ligase|nr:UDP-N-acetylmuramoylalanine--D-glutamate ligase [Candidatus Parcubacteria bacterium]